MGNRILDNFSFAGDTIVISANSQGTLLFQPCSFAEIHCKSHSLDMTGSFGFRRSPRLDFGLMTRFLKPMTANEQRGALPLWHRTYRFRFLMG